MGNSWRIRKKKWTESEWQYDSMICTTYKCDSYMANGQSAVRGVAMWKWKWNYIHLVQRAIHLVSFDSSTFIEVSEIAWGMATTQLIHSIHTHMFSIVVQWLDQLCRKNPAFCGQPAVTTMEKATRAVRETLNLPMHKQFEMQFFGHNYSYFLFALAPIIWIYGWFHCKLHIKSETVYFCNSYFTRIQTREEWERY